MEAQYLNLLGDPETQEARLYCTACPPNRRTSTPRHPGTFDSPTSTNTRPSAIGSGEIRGFQVPLHSHACVMGKSHRMLL